MFRHLGTVTARVLVVLALAVAAVPAAVAEEETPDCYYKSFDAEGNPVGPAFCTQQVWFHQAQTKAGNLGALGATDYPYWDTNPPTASVTTGAGGGYLTNGADWQLNGEKNELLGAVFEGGFTGAIDTIAVDLWMLAPTKQQDPTYDLGVVLEVDGVEVARVSTVNTPLRPDGDAALKTDFVLTDVQRVLTMAGIESGDGIEHDLRLFITAYPLATTTAIFVYDTTEVPSGLTFNATDLDGRLVVPLW